MHFFLGTLRVKIKSLLQVRESVLQSLKSVDMEDLPIVVKFLLHSISGTDAVVVNL